MAQSSAKKLKINFIDCLCGIIFFLSISSKTNIHVGSKSLSNFLQYQIHVYVFPLIPLIVIFQYILKKQSTIILQIKTFTGYSTGLIFVFSLFYYFSIFAHWKLVLPTCTARFTIQCWMVIMKSNQYKTGYQFSFSKCVFYYFVHVSFFTENTA